MFSGRTPSEITGVGRRGGACHDVVVGRNNRSWEKEIREDDERYLLDFRLLDWNGTSAVRRPFFFKKQSPEV